MYVCICQVIRIAQEVIVLSILVVSGSAQHYVRWSLASVLFSLVAFLLVVIVRKTKTSNPLKHFNNFRMLTQRKVAFNVYCKSNAACGLITRKHA
jgi:archaellum biogenesis protein FlaJ (TadC family)